MSKFWWKYFDEVCQIFFHLIPASVCVSRILPFFWFFVLRLKVIVRRLWEHPDLTRLLCEGYICIRRERREREERERERETDDILIWGLHIRSSQHCGSDKKQAWELEVVLYFRRLVLHITTCHSTVVNLGGHMDITGSNSKYQETYSQQFF